MPRKTSPRSRKSPTRSPPAKSRMTVRSPARSPRRRRRSPSPQVRARSPGRPRKIQVSSPEKKRKPCPRKDGGCMKKSVTVNLNRGVVKRDYAKTVQDPITSQTIEKPEGPPIVRTIRKMSYKQKHEVKTPEKMAVNAIEVESPSKILWQFMNRA